MPTNLVIGRPHPLPCPLCKQKAQNRGEEEYVIAHLHTCFLFTAGFLGADKFLWFSFQINIEQWNAAVAALEKGNTG